MTETEQKERQEIEDSRGWRVLCELENLLIYDINFSAISCERKESYKSIYNKIKELKEIIK